MRIFKNDRDSHCTVQRSIYQEVKYFDSVRNPSSVSESKSLAPSSSSGGYPGGYRKNIETGKTCMIIGWRIGSATAAV